MRPCALLALLALSGCGLAHESDGVGADGGGVPLVDSSVPSSAHARTYVIGRLLAEPPLSFDSSWGFDLDGMVGGLPGSCSDQMDYVSPVTGAGGVDNQFGTLVPALDALVAGDGIDGVYRERIQSGDLVAVIEVTGIDSEIDDPSVQVHVVLAQPTTGGAPAPSPACSGNSSEATCVADQVHACNWSTVLTRCSGIASGQHYAARMDFGTSVGSIVGGRLSATATALPLEIFIGPMSLPLVLHDVRIAGALRGDAIVDGELGGTVLVSELMDDFAALGFAIDVTSFVQPDLMPSASGTCSGISTGMGFAAIAATLD